MQLQGAYSCGSAYKIQLLLIPFRCIRDDNNRYSEQEFDRSWEQGGGGKGLHAAFIEL